jgi:hypothetical protein
MITQINEIYYSILSFIIKLKGLEFLKISKFCKETFPMLKHGKLNSI